MDVRCANVLKTETRTVLCEFYTNKTNEEHASRKNQTFQYNLFIPPFAIVQPDGKTKMLHILFLLLSNPIPANLPHDKPKIFPPYGDNSLQQHF